MGQQQLFRFDVQEDPNEREQWEEFAARYPREKTNRLTLSMWNYFRQTLKVNPRKTSKNELSAMMHDLVKGKQVGNLQPTWDEDRHRYTGQYKVARETARRMVDLKTGKPKGAWKRGLYYEVRTLHQMKSSRGKVYVRSYRAWTDTEIRVLKSPASLEKKAILLGRSEKSVKRKIERLRP